MRLSRFAYLCVCIKLVVSAWKLLLFSGMFSLCQSCEVGTIIAAHDSAHRNTPSCKGQTSGNCFKFKWQSLAFGSYRSKISASFVVGCAQHFAPPWRRRLKLALETSAILCSFSRNLKMKSHSLKAANLSWLWESIWFNSAEFHSKFHHRVYSIWLLETNFANSKINQTASGCTTGRFHQPKSVQ